MDLIRSSVDALFQVGFEEMGVLVEVRFTMLHSAPQLNPCSHVNLIWIEHSQKQPMAP